VRQPVLMPLIAVAIFLSICLSVTLWYCVETAVHIFKLISPRRSVAQFP